MWLGACEIQYVLKSVCGFDYVGLWMGLVVLVELMVLFVPILCHKLCLKCAFGLHCKHGTCDGSTADRS